MFSLNMSENIHLNSKNISLIQLRIEDIHDLFKLTDLNRIHLRQWLPWLDHTTQETDTLKFIKGTIETAEKGKGLNLGIWKKEVLIGVIGFNSIDKTDKKAVIGYWLGKDFEGKGDMTNACKMLLEYGFEKLQLHRIEIRCATENEKSCNIPIRLGFTHEGTLREAEWLYDHFVSHNVYSLLESEWPK